MHQPFASMLNNLNRVRLLVGLILIANHQIIFHDETPLFDYHIFLAEPSAFLHHAYRYC